MKMNTKSYNELITIKNYRDRFNYLKLNGKIGESTFGSSRWINQVLYNSYDWKIFRREMVIRDLGCDIGCADHPIGEGQIIHLHHINPISVEDILNHNQCVFDPNNVITLVDRTHKAVHYGDDSLLYPELIERTQYDTCPWRR